MSAVLGPSGLGGGEPFALASPLAQDPEIPITSGPMTGPTSGASEPGSAWFTGFGDLLGISGQNIFMAAAVSGTESPDSPERTQADLLNFEKFLESRTTIGGRTMKITTLLLIAGAVWFLFLRK